MPDSAVRVDFLKRLHLFRGLSDMQVLSVAEAMREVICDSSQVVIEQGKATDALYFIFKGRVIVSQRQKDNKEKKLTSLLRGDYFGEASLLTGNPPSASVTADAGTVLLAIDREKFKSFLSSIADLKLNFGVMMASRSLARKLNFSWLGEDEIIYFLARKHPFLLYSAMVQPLVLVLLPITLVVLAFALPQFSLALAGLGGFLLVLDLAWGMWRYVDWTNDYYVVTNQRAVWIEKVVGLYDSRREASMNTILSVNTETEQWGRIFGYGTVVVRTFTGELRLDYVTNPKQAAAMIEEYWLRSRERTRSTEQDVMKKAIMSKLNPPPPKPPAPPASVAFR